MAVHISVFVTPAAAVVTEEVEFFFMDMLFGLRSRDRVGLNGSSWKKHVPCGFGDVRGCSGCGGVNSSTEWNGWFEMQVEMQVKMQV